MDGVPRTEKALNTYMIKECGYILDKMIIIETLTRKKIHSENHHLRDLKNLGVCTLCSYPFKQSEPTQVSYYIWPIRSSCREKLFQKISLVHSPLTPDPLLLLLHPALQTRGSVPLTLIGALRSFRFDDWQNFLSGSWNLCFPPGSCACSPPSDYDFIRLQKYPQDNQINPQSAKST